MINVVFILGKQQANGSDNAQYSANPIRCLPPICWENMPVDHCKFFELGLGVGQEHHWHQVLP